LKAISVTDCAQNTVRKTEITVRIFGLNFCALCDR